MELPKNITQIGEVGRDCKIYVEDYVVSYMKQLNRAAQDKDMAVALYGKREEENGVVYYFVYGAGKLDFLQREVRHLSQAQRQEIDRLRKRYFPELTFTGYRLLDGDMIEGFHICEQDICRYISGYAQFYEKNDAMLAYMLDVREAAQPEQVNQEKYEEVKRRQEERRAAAERPARSASVSEGAPQSARNRESSARNVENMRHMPTSVNLQKMRLTAVGVFALLCLLGIATFRENEIRNKDSQEVGNAGVLATSGGVQKDTLLMEDKLEQALLQENQSMEQSDEPEKESKAPDQAQQGGEPTGETVQEEKSSGESEESQPSAAQTPQDQSSGQTTPSQPPTETKPTSEPETSQAVSGAVAYVIQPGDTLTAISKRQYGTDIRVADICNLNKISNPDDIKQGQVIMLPR
ncbi:MAG: LysM peptidoglycan-binding domain-containing protein [Acetatifactor sp.]|nr:LysM peptidoglycan-binding domain-containing protein [Acetatifactor sp.]